MKYAPLLLAAACSGSSAPVAPPAHHVASTLAPVDRGLDHERGRGVKRDYQAAIAAYREACAAGCGDLPSCERLFRLAVDNRGVVIDGTELMTLIARMCDRHDVQACIMAVMGGARDEGVLPQYERGDAALEDCERGKLGVCQLVMFSAGFNFGGSSAVEEREHSAEEQACLLGDLEGCKGALDHQAYECEERGHVEMGDACIEWQAAEWHGEHLDDETDKLRRIYKTATTACNDGDADACAAVGRPIAPATLCEAGDYGVCKKLAENGDVHAKQIACAAGLDVGCEPKLPPRPTPYAIGSGLRWLRDACDKDHQQQACDALAKELERERCPAPRR